MPALPDVPQVLRVRYELSIVGDGPEAHVHQYWQYSGTAPTNSDAQTFATAVQSAWGSHLKENFHSIWGLDGVDVTDLTSSSGAIGFSTGARIAGTNSGDALPIDTATMVSYGVHRRYRGGHPREYWPAGTQADMSNESTWTSAYIDQFQADISALNTAIAALSIGSATLVGHVNVSYYEGFTVHTGTTGRARNVPTPRTSPVIDPIVSTATASFIAVQRRRRGKV